MGTKLTRIPLQVQTICRGSWRFQYIARRATYATAVKSTNLAHGLLDEKLNAEVPKRISNGASIYRVPAHLRAVEPKAYEPNIVSIGPYHHGKPPLQAMENTKRSFCQGLFNPSDPNSPNKNAVLDELKQMEQQARSCYSEDLKIKSEQFIDMMLVDSCC